MKKLLFPKLALTGIKKNKSIYLPYLLSCIGSVAMFYIIEALSVSETVAALHGGHNLISGFNLGKYIIAVFDLIFLLYTNSFLIRRRNKEFGLYNILGMTKNNISRIIFYETLFTSLVSVLSGLFFGVILFKLAELGLLYTVKADADFNFGISLQSVLLTALVFFVIFAVLLIKSVITVRKNDTAMLMQSEKSAEKPPKANFVVALLGIILLTGAYAVSVSIESPIAALLIFFFAVIAVIIATYLLFIAGSVALCRILKNNKKYYYKKNHFISVSSMAFRMKRNGAGLASVCILSTMVLVMLASSASLYFGSEDSIKSRFPRNNEIVVTVPQISAFTQKNKLFLQSEYEKVFENHSAESFDITEFTYSQISGILSNDGKNYINPESDEDIYAILKADDLRTLYFVSAADYNKFTGENLTVNPGEAYYFSVRCNFDNDTLDIGNFHLKISGKTDKTVEIGEANTGVVPSLIFVINSLNEISPLENLTSDGFGEKLLDTKWYYGYNLPNEDEEATAICKEQYNITQSCDFLADAENTVKCNFSTIAEERGDFYTTFGGLFFIGILLSIIFIFAMAMIIYYKQISEGYEDAARFAIMKKVGMTEKDIKKSINSQILTVFFAPLLFSGLHFCFAFPPIWKILHLFNLFNLPLVIGVSCIAFVLFGVFYAVIYKTTARAYYNIVSASENV